jgi:hypothetical protein
MIGARRDPIPRARATGTFETAGGDWPYWRFEVIEVG